jgi:hypothetical protein
MYKLVRFTNAPIGAGIDPDSPFAVQSMEITVKLDESQVTPLILQQVSFVYVDVEPPMATQIPIVVKQGCDAGDVDE